jgi:hypothetical protein
MNASAVVGDLDSLAAAVLDVYVDGGGPGINGVFDEFFDDGGGPFHDLTGRDLGSHLIRENVNCHMAVLYHKTVMSMDVEEVLFF